MFNIAARITALPIAYEIFGGNHSSRTRDLFHQLLRFFQVDIEYAAIYIHTHTATDR